MATFSSLLSSIGGPPKAPQQPSGVQRPSQPGQQPWRGNGLGSSTSLSANNAAAGVKRKSEEPEQSSRTKTARTGQNDVSNRPAATAPSSRFQLSGKPGASQKPSGSLQSSAPKPSISSNLQRPVQSSISQKPASTSPTPPSTANGPPPQKRGFASIMEKAKAAQEAAKAAGQSGIKHKPVERITKRERLRLREEANAQQKTAKSGRVVDADRSRSGTPLASRAGPQKKEQNTNYKGTMKKAAEPISYKGTMRAADKAAAKDWEKKKGLAQDKYGGYASWSDLDDAEDEEEEGEYDSEASSDMEGGFDDIEKEDQMAARAAWQEDKEAMEEEERLRREKLERKRKLEQLSKSAAARKKY